MTSEDGLTDHAGAGTRRTWPRTRFTLRPLYHSHPTDTAQQAFVERGRLMKISAEFSGDIIASAGFQGLSRLTHTDTRNNHSGSPEQLAWDEAIDALDGDLLQQWNWGEFKRRHGWDVERVTSDSGSRAQILFRHYGPVSLGYIPRGPVLDGDEDDHLELLHEIDGACVQHRAVSLFLEPSRPIPDTWLDHGQGFSPSSRTIQSPRTVLVDLSLDDDELIRRMRKDTRYNISYARRHGMIVERAPFTEEALDQFFALLSETAQRADFGIHDRAYYADFLDLFQHQSVLLFARQGSEVTAGLIASRYGTCARSMYAGTRQRRRARGDAALLRFAAMQWAREHGCTSYDLGGIAPKTPASIGGASFGFQSETVESLKGVEKFKTGFGGQIVQFPTMLERTYRPYIATIARRLIQRSRRNSD